MSEQASLEQYRDEMTEAVRGTGERLALEGVDDHWQTEAWRELRRLADSGRSFTADDLAEAVGAPSSPGAVGALFAAGRRSGLIATTGYATSRRIGRHSGLQRVWRGPGVAE
jgi:hypothetical protein